MLQSFVTTLCLAVVSMVACSPVSKIASTRSGQYVGINPIVASRGASFKESKVAFSLDSAGIILDTTVLSHGKPLEFKIHFTPEWIFSLQGWGVEKCLAVRQHRKSTLAQLIFCFAEDFPEASKQSSIDFDAEMTLGEGMPASLGLFVRIKDDTDSFDVGRRVRKFYDASYKPRIEQESKGWLNPVDISEAMQVMGSRDPYRKIKVLENATHNLWTGTEEEIRDRLTLVAMGLEDTSPEVQKQALVTFGIGGRVIGGVDLVARFLQKKNLREDVLVEGLNAATYLLYEAHGFNRDVALLRNVFGTTDPEVIQKKTNGIISPNHYEVLNKFSQRKPQIRWTREHQIVLTNAILQAVSNPTEVSSEALKVAAEALREYPVIQ